MVVLQELGQIERADIGELWGDDVAFARWLAENLKALGEPLHMDLELVRLQPPAGWFSLAILAKEVGTDATVVIGNRRNLAIHYSLGKIAGYAAAHDARIIIWVASEFRTEHREALEWLNKWTPEEIEAYGVELRVIRIDDSLPAPEFRPVVFSDAWAKRARGAMYSLSPAAQRRFDFFQPLLEDLWNADFTNRTTARMARMGGETFASGFPGITYNAGFNFHHATVCLWISTGDAGKNELIYEGLLRNEGLMKNQMPGIEFDLIGRLGGGRHVSIGIARLDALDQPADAQSNTRQWMFDNLLKLKEVCYPPLESVMNELNAEEIAASAEEPGFGNPGDIPAYGDDGQSGSPTPTDTQEGQ